MSVQTLAVKAARLIAMNEASQVADLLIRHFEPWAYRADCPYYTRIYFCHTENVTLFQQMLREHKLDGYATVSFAE
jgi:hypothetical protein